MNGPPMRLQDLPYDISERVRGFIIGALEPQVLFLEVDGLKNDPAKLFRDMDSDTYKYIDLEGRKGSEVGVADTEAPNSSVSRQRLVLSTWRVRLLGSFCTNSPQAIMKTYPHVLGLRFMHRLNKAKDVGRIRGIADDGLLRFNCDTDHCIIFAAQWERQTHFLRNQHNVKGAFKHIRNLGLDLLTLWNDRLLQALDSFFLSDSVEILRADPRGASQFGYTFLRGFELHDRPPNPRRLEWRGACRCRDPDLQSDDADWIAGGPPPRPPCPFVCRREPLPVFTNALPRVRTLVFTDMDSPIKSPKKAAKAHGELFSPGHDGKHALITDGEKQYSVTNPFYRRAAVRLSTPECIRSGWNSKFPYLRAMPKARIKYMRPIREARRLRERDDSSRPFRSNDTDIPYIFEVEEPQPTSSRKRSRHSSGSEGDRKRQRQNHSSSSGGGSGGKGRRRKSRGRSRGRRRSRKSSD